MKTKEYRDFYIQPIKSEDGKWYADIENIEQGWGEKLEKCKSKRTAINEAKRQIDEYKEIKKWYKITYSGHSYYRGTIVFSDIYGLIENLDNDISNMNAKEKVELILEIVMMSHEEFRASFGCEWDGWD